MTRTRVLPSGWYPSTSAEVERQLQEWEASLPPADERFCAVIVPHAGWAFSGRIAYRTIRALIPDVSAIVVVGGHLRPGDPVMIAPEDAYEIPGGEARADGSLAEELTRRLETAPDVRADNTVEVQLPIVHALFPRARLLSVRVPPDQKAVETGRIVHEYASTTGRDIAVIGSTDLTHYGPNYGFETQGSGREAERWAREVNDRSVIEAMLVTDARRVMDLGTRERAACSSGAAAAAISFAVHSGATSGTLVEYGQSSDVHPGSSFVGYAGVGFSGVVRT